MSGKEKGILFAAGIVCYEQMRYSTAGDWHIDPDDGAICILAADTGDWQYNLLIAIHELIEAALCQQRGISEADVTAFDVAFEASRQPGITGEPGDDPAAPYNKEHKFATVVERLVADELGVDWSQYEAAIAALEK